MPLPALCPKGEIESGQRIFPRITKYIRARMAFCFFKGQRTKYQSHYWRGNLTVGLSSYSSSPHGQGTLEINKDFIVNES